MTEINEIWVDVIGYEGLYQVSNQGRIKSLPKTWSLYTGAIMNKGETILNSYLNKHGYQFVRLCKDGKHKNKTVHRLVWESFNGETKLYVLHNVEGNKLDNRLSNLHIGNCRQNSSEYFLSIKKASKYIGVTWNKKYKKWHSNIQINGKRKWLGQYDTEEQAHLAYCNFLNTLSI